MTSAINRLAAVAACGSARLTSTIPALGHHRMCTAAGASQDTTPDSVLLWKR